MKSKKNKNNTGNLIFMIIAVLLIIAIVGGGTYAWWQWQSSNEQKTNVTITISKPNFEIVADSISSSAMTPTSYCYNNTEQGTNILQKTMAGRATVTATNNTNSGMTVYIKLKAKVSASIGDTAPAKVNWALVEVPANNTAFSNDICIGNSPAIDIESGTFAQMGASENSNISTNFQDIETGISYTVNTGVTSTKYYHVYVWIDSTYTATNTGGTVSDPLQNKTFTVTFSENSLFTQGS